MKKLILSVVVMSLSGLTVIAQELPAAGKMKLVSGKYSITLLPARSFMLSGFAYDDTNLFVSDAATAGAFIQPSKAPEKLISLKVTVNGKVPEKIAHTLSGELIEIERETLFGAVKLQTFLKLTPKGLAYSVRYKIETTEKPGYLYLATMPWNTGFTEWMTHADGKSATGNLVSDGDWKLNSDLNWMAVYWQEQELGVVTGVLTPVPVTGRKHAIWDHRSYHKYFLSHKLPDWKAGYESPLYTLEFRVFKAAAPQWKREAEITAEAMAFPPAFGTGRKLNQIEIVPPGPISGRNDWASPRRGIEALHPDFVLPPFVPVEADAAGAAVWNRHYKIADNGLLKESLIGGRDFLARPMTLDIMIDGEKINFRPLGTRLIENYKGKAVYSSESDAAKAKLEVKTTVEYDGMIRVDLSLIPKQAIIVDKFEYAFHLPDGNAKYLHFIGCPPVNGLSIMVPKESMTFGVPEKTGVFFSEPFKTLVWLGNDDEGFLWFSPSEQNFYPEEPAERPAALQAEKKDRETTFRVTPVSKPLKTADALNYTFGFFATPVRPMPEKWRTWFLTTRRAMYGSEKAHGYVGNMPMIWPDEHRSTAAPCFSEESEAKMRRFAGELHKEGRNALGYTDPIRVHIGYLKYLDEPSRGAQLNDLFLAPASENDAFLYRVPVIAENMKKWQTHPELIYSYGAARGGREVRVSGASEWADFYCFLIECYAKLGYDGMGDIDNCFPIRDMNELHGAGFVRRDGKRHWQWDWFERRDLMKRMAAIFLKERGKPGILIAHASATWAIPFISFCDANMTYEHSNSGYYASKSFLSKYGRNNEALEEMLRRGDPGFLRHAFPPERWRAELTGRQFGLPCVIMSNLTKSPQLDKELAGSRVHARALAANIIAHDAIMWPIWCDTAPMVELQKIRERFGVGEQDVIFHPYWEQNLVTAGKTPFSIGVYTRPGKALVTVSNLTDNALSGEIDFSKLKMQTVRNAETQEIFKGGAMTLAPYDYVIFEAFEK